MIDQSHDNATTRISGKKNSRRSSNSKSTRWSGRGTRNPEYIYCIFVCRKTYKRNLVFFLFAFRFDSGAAKTKFQMETVFNICPNLTTSLSFARKLPPPSTFHQQSPIFATNSFRFIKLKLAETINGFLTFKRGIQKTAHHLVVILKCFIYIRIIRNVKIEWAPICNRFGTATKGNSDSIKSLEFSL